MKKYSHRKRSAPKRRYKKKTTAAKIGRAMQNKSLSYVKKKYTVVIPINVRDGEEFAQSTISHIAGKNSTTPAFTLTINDCNPDNMLLDQMKLYQFFKITGVGFKIFFPEGTTPEATPCQWSMGYSSNQLINPSISFDRLQTLQNYMTSSCSATRPISRYFKTGGTLARLGIDWCNTQEITDFGASPPTQLYGEQLPIDAGSSTNIKVYRPATNVTGAAQLGRLQLTYYVLYKGAKGQSSLTV